MFLQSTPPSNYVKYSYTSCNFSCAPKCGSCCPSHCYYCYHYHFCWWCFCQYCCCSFYFSSSVSLYFFPLVSRKPSLFLIVFLLVSSVLFQWCCYLVNCQLMCMNYTSGLTHQFQIQWIHSCYFAYLCISILFPSQPIWFIQQDMLSITLTPWSTDSFMINLTSPYFYPFVICTLLQANWFACWVLTDK